MILLRKKTSHRKATTSKKQAEQYQSIALKNEFYIRQNKIKKMIEKNNQPSQDRIKSIIKKNKLLREPLF